MSNWTKFVLDMIKKQGMIEINRKPIDPATIKGFPLALTDEFLLLHFASDDVFLNGYEIVRVEDIKRYRSAEGSFRARALQLRDQVPKRQPKIDLTSMATIFDSVGKRFPLITIHRERMDNSVCYIGKVARMTERTVTLDEIDADAEWDRIRRYNFRDITRISFGGSYESALWLVSCAETGNKRQLSEARRKESRFRRLHF